MAPVLGYWAIRGLGQQIRLIQAYTGEEYEDKRYTEPDQWFSVKYTLGLDFPNLPYYIDGDVKLTQSLAIMKHIGRKHGLVGSTEEEKRRVDMTESQINDMRLYYVMLVYFSSKDEFEGKKAEYLTKLPDKLKELSAFLGTNTYFAGDKLTYADFLVYDILDVHKVYFPECLDQFSNLSAFQARIEAFPTVAAYIKSPQFLNKPINGPTANA